MTKQKSCGVLIYKKVQGEFFVLLGHATNQTRWDIFKGRIGQNETYLECAKRELKEETGIEFLDEKYNKSEFHHFPNYLKKKELYVIPIRVLNEELDVQSLKAQNLPELPYPEFDEYRWINYKDISHFVGNGLNNVINYFYEKFN